MESRRIAVLGGSFNPVHNGHLVAAKETLRVLDCDEVWLLPCYKQAEGKKTAAPKHRLAMARIAVKTLRSGKIKASDLEIRFLKKKNYTADTVSFLQKRFPRAEFYWIFGSELVKQFPHWIKWNELRKLLPLVIYPRKGFKTPSQKFLRSLGAKFILPPRSVRQSGVSSTQVRMLLEKKNANAGKSIPPQVLNYIRKHNLYGWGK